MPAGAVSAGVGSAGADPGTVARSSAFTGQGPTGLLGVAAVAVLYLRPCTEWLQEARPSE